MSDTVALCSGPAGPRRAPRSPRSLLAVACALGGCAGGGAGSGSFAMARAAAVPPLRSNRSTARRRRCSTAWSACSTANRSCATCRSSPARARASYRVRSYLSAQVVRGRTMIAWVWDVYDRNQQRALRLSGEEPAGKAGRDAWAAADDLVLRKIAQAGLSGLSGMINGTPPRMPRLLRPRPPRPRGGERGKRRLPPRVRRRRRARLQRPVNRSEIVPYRPIFARENRARRVASRAPSLISPRPSKRAGSEGFSIC